MITLGIEQEVYRRFGDFEAQVKKIKEHGFDCIDYQGFLPIAGNPVYESMDEAAFEAHVKGLKEILDRYGVKVSQTHSPWRYPPTETTRELQEQRVQHIIRAMKGTALLGCDRTVVHPLMPDGTHNIGKEKNTKEANLWALKTLCKAAEKYQVYLCLENMPMLRYTLARVQDVVDLVKEINHPYLKVCLDTGHAAVFEHPLGDAVRTIGKDLLYALHVHDNDGTGDRHWCPFDGISNWEDFAAALKEIGFEGTISLECGVKKNIPDELLDGEFIALRNRADYLRKKAQ